MTIQTIKTHRLTTEDSNLITLLDQYIEKLEEGSVVAITSKIISICENNVVPFGQAVKQDLIVREADYYLPATNNTYGLTLTIKNGIMIPSAGIDESNSANGYILWPRDPQKTANQVCSYLRERFGLASVGVVITDSKTTPLRRGTMGVCLAHSGFLALNDYVGKPDLFDRPLRMTKANVADGLAAAAVLCMGEGSEQTPLAILDDLDFVQFQDRDPNQEELAELQISLEDDIYSEILMSTKWHQ